MIRIANYQDIKSVLELTKACASHMVDNCIFQWNEYYPNKEAFEKDIKRKELFVLQSDNLIIGCIVVSSFMDEEYKSISWLTPNKNNFYIHRLAVHPDHQGKGHAQQLMDFAENKAKQEQKVSIRLDTFSQNSRNQKFYNNRGYSQLGQIFFPKQSKHPFYCYELVL